MPVLNRADTILRALNSIVEQHYPNLELIILDAGSTDGTVDIIKQYAAHIHYWHSLPDGGPVKAINQGIKLATGEIIGQLMADDFFSPGTFIKVAEAYNADPEARMITCGGKIIRFEANEGEYKVLKNFSTPSSLQLNFKNICFASSAICCRFIHRSVYAEIGLFKEADEQGKNLLASDKLFLLMASLHKVRNIFIPHTGYYYVAHSESSTFGNNNQNLMRLCKEHQFIASYLLNNTPLSLQHKLQLIYWYYDQSVRFVLFKLLAREWSAAGTEILQGVKKNCLLWSMIACITVPKLVLMRSLRWVASKG